jgi:hypothetical protein
LDYRNHTIELKNNGLDFLNRQVDGEKFQTAEWVDPDAEYPGLIGSLGTTPTKGDTYGDEFVDIFPPIIGENRPNIVWNDTTTGATLFRLSAAKPLVDNTKTALYNGTLVTAYWSAANVITPKSKRLQLWGTVSKAAATTFSRGGVDSTGVVLVWDALAAGYAGAAPLLSVAVAAGGILTNATAGMPGFEWKATLYNSLADKESPAMRCGVGALSFPSGGNASITWAVDFTGTAFATCGGALAAGWDKVRIYRKGGAIVDGYRLSGETTNAGGAGVAIGGTDGLTAAQNDLVLSVASKLNEDLYWAYQTPLTPVRNVTTVDWTSGHYLGAGALLFGPFQGDVTFSFSSITPQRVYWTQPGKWNLWDPTSNFIDVCGPDESIKAGVIFNGIPYVFTESNCYALDFGGMTALPMFKPRITSIGIGVSNLLTRQESTLLTVSLQWRRSVTRVYKTSLPLALPHRLSDFWG